MHRPSASGVFATVGRLSVRYRWPVVGFWVVVVVVCSALLPSLGSVVKNNNTAFLPPSSPSLEAQALAAPLLGGSQASGVLVASTTGGRLTETDQSAFARIEAATRRLRSVVAVRDGPISADGQARTAQIVFEASSAGGGPSATSAVGKARAIAAHLAPAGLQVNVSGTVPELIDQQQAGSRTVSHVQVLSVVFILLLLLLAFRSTLAPFVTLAPAALALAVASPIIAESTKAGVQISSLLQLLLTALVLGAGTDYGLFLIFRYRENLGRGLAPREAIVASVERVGESVTFSALTVIAALLTLLLASFGLYRGVGPGLAIGIGVVLLVELTFFPAVLAILGRAVWWPSMPRPGTVRPGRWGVVAARVVRRPLVAVGLGTLFLGGLAAGLAAYAPSGFNPGGAIAGSDSAAGLDALESHFGPAALGVTDVVFRLRTSVFVEPQLLASGEEGLETSRRFSSIGDALNASGIRISPSDLAVAFQRLGPPEELPAVPPPGLRVTPALYDAYRSTAQYVTPDGRTVLYKTSLRAGGPGTTAALQSIPAIRRDVTRVGSVIGATRSGVAGQASGAADVSELSGADIVHIAPVVLAILAAILAVVLRSLVAPVYLVLSVALSYLASLGLAVLLFVVLGGELGINFTLPFFLFVFIMALGEDYNILVMTRIREEAQHLPLREAITVAVGQTGTTVTSAGLVLSSTFGVLAAATSGQVRQIAIGLALGILLDTFVVRTLLVPSAAVMLGRYNWWPSRLARR